MYIKLYNSSTFYDIPCNVINNNKCYNKCNCDRASICAFAYYYFDVCKRKFPPSAGAQVNSSVGPSQSGQTIGDFSSGSIKLGCFKRW